MIILNKATISITVFSGSDDHARFAAAMAYLRNNPGTTLFVPPGVYTFTSKQARNAQTAVMDGKYGSNPQKVMFRPDYAYTRGIDFSGQQSTKISAYGAAFLIDGFMELLTLSDCENVEVMGLTIDHHRKPFSRGKVSSTQWIDGETVSVCVTLDSDCPVTANTPMMLRHLFWDHIRGGAINAVVQSVSFADPYHLVMTVTSTAEIPEGTTCYIWHTYHSRPAILIENAKNIHLTDVTIHSQPGMGVLGNRCEDVTITRLAVIPAKGYHVSTNTDATHFTACKGLLRYEDCLFIGQGDDSANVHAYYQAVVGKDGDQVYFIQEKTPDGTHAQSLDYPDVGDQLELVQRDTLMSQDIYIVQACTPMPNAWMCRIELDRPLPDDTQELMLSNITRLPRLEISGCRAEAHFARSILIKTRDALVENCIFRNVMGPAIVAAAESWWYEGVCPANVTIRGNRIENCGCFWGEASGIVVKADAPNAAGQSIYSLRIEDNEIDAPGCKHGIFVRNVAGLHLCNNYIRSADTPIVIEDCTEVTEG